MVAFYHLSYNLDRFASLKYPKEFFVSYLEKTLSSEQNGASPCQRGYITTTKGDSAHCAAAAQERER